MKVVRGEEARPLTFEDLEEGETFTELGDSQLLIKTDEGSGCCLEDGTLKPMYDDEKVTRIACEVRVV